MKKDVIAQGVPLDGLQESLPTAFEPFEEVGPAETHQPFAGSGEIAEPDAFRGRRRVVGVGEDVVRQAVPRQLEPIDVNDHSGRVKTGVLVVRVFLVDLELDPLWPALGEHELGAVFETSDSVDWWLRRAWRNCP